MIKKKTIKPGVVDAKEKSVREFDDCCPGDKKIIKPFQTSLIKKKSFQKVEPSKGYEQ